MSEPVAIVFRRRVRAGAGTEYEAWLAGLSAETRRVPGYLGVEIVRPAPGGQEYLSVFRFESLGALTDWERSELRREWVARLPHHELEGDVEIDRHEGLEAWFRAGDTPVRAPVKWKMALVLATVVYALLLVLGPLVTMALGETTPLWIRQAVSVSIEVCLMTWLVLPRVTKLLGSWLYT